MYSVDASLYQEEPNDVIFPKTEQELIEIVQFAKQNELSIIPRGAGTSLGGQCVGPGLVLDFSQQMHQVLHVDVVNQLVTVQPGVIRDALNQQLKSLGFLFGPNTATSNRATIGGMIGNSSCGSYSIVYGNTRDQLHAVRMVLEDGTIADFREISNKELKEKCALKNAEGRIYRLVHEILSKKENRELIEHHFPHPKIHRRNSGYALDLLAKCAPYTTEGPPLNLCKLIAGSEGTLGIITEATLRLHPLPPEHSSLLCIQFPSLILALQSVPIILKHAPFALELMDQKILECAGQHPMHLPIIQKYMPGTPEAVLFVELKHEQEESLNAICNRVIQEVQHFSNEAQVHRVYDTDITAVWKVRTAGLGVLTNLPGTAKSHEFVEDTAVLPEQLAEYIQEFQHMLSRHQTQAIFYAHAGAGELHVRPILDLHTEAGRKVFRKIGEDSARLVKKYRGSLSGEHGDGRVRSEFLKHIYHPTILDWFLQIKNVFDPYHIFNPGKIVTPLSMDTNLQDARVVNSSTINTFLDFSQYEGGIREAITRCTGSADCRAPSGLGGVMCPSFRATQKEEDSTRGRAHVLRSLIEEKGETAFYEDACPEVLDLCLSCKACHHECPSSVDMALIKSEVMHQYYRKYGQPIRNYLFAHQDLINRWMRFLPKFIIQLLFSTFQLSLAPFLGINAKKKLPIPSGQSLQNWIVTRQNKKIDHPRGTVYFFCDEFTNDYHVNTGKRAIQLLEALGYQVLFKKHAPSGRAAISTSMLQYARKCADKNISVFSECIEADIPLIGIDPSAMSCFQDEYVKVCSPELRDTASTIAPHVMIIESFLAREIREGRITQDLFDQVSRSIVLHIHCHASAAGWNSDISHVCAFPSGHQVHVLEANCCGMAGQFGYVAAHEEVSESIAQLTLIPALTTLKTDQVFITSGMSCRQQALDFTGVKALHPVEVLWEAVKK